MGKGFWRETNVGWLRQRAGLCRGHGEGSGAGGTGRSLILLCRETRDGDSGTSQRPHPCSAQGVNFI